MAFRFVCSLLTLTALAALSAAIPPAARLKTDAKPVKDVEKPNFARDVAPLVNKYCVSCHKAPKPRAGFNLERFKDDASAARDRAAWEKVVHALRSREMPPRRRPQPRQAEVERLIAWVDANLQVDCNQARDPGRVTLRRLNRVEYNNTIRDLVGVDFQPADDFPADDVGYGFDNIGDVLSLPPLLVEKYLAAADKIVARAFESRDCRKRLGLLFRPGERPSPERLRKVVENFARRAYRRPVTEAEVTRLLRFVDLAEKQGDGWEKGLQLTFQAVLVSPNFLFRVEQEPDRDAPNGVRRLNDFELASRLSYFLWSTMPDEELFALAGKGELRQGDNLERQVRRMLKDPKAHAFVENFAGQWLQLRNLKTAAPDPGTYPAFDDSLRAAMQKETELFFEAVLKEDRSILDFLDADFTFVNERLARHYGIAGVKGNEFRRVQLPDRRRGGVLTQASVLTVTSNPTRTSPVKRGKFIMENILGTPPPPPAPDAGELKEGGELKGTLRQRMEQHRANPNCAVCHQKMDPLGFGFENFDGIGSWRTKEGKFDIDPSGVLPGGEKFNGPAELKAVLKKMDGQFRRCLTEKMLTYALGRGLEYYDKCVVDDISAQVAKDNNKLSRLVIEVVRSDPFQMRRRYKGGR